jgi:hypothetical protein
VVVSARVTTPVTTLSAEEGVPYPWVSLIEATAVGRSRAASSVKSRMGMLGGRPSVWTPEKRELAQRMLVDGMTVATVAKVLGISRASL